MIVGKFQRFCFARGRDISVNLIKCESCQHNVSARAEINTYCFHRTFCLNISISIVMRELCWAVEPMSVNRSHGHGLEITMGLSVFG